MRLEFRSKATSDSLVEIMQLRIKQRTVYAYDKPVAYGLQQIRLTPKSRSGQAVRNWRIDVHGGKKELEFDDQHNNHTVLVSHEDSCEKITIECSGNVETSDTSGVIGEHGGFAPLWYFMRSTDLTAPGTNFEKLLKNVDRTSLDEISKMHAVSEIIRDAIKYESGKTHAGTTADEALECGYGVCQDHAHTFITAARLLGHPSRYVSGYMMLNDRIDQQASHAWAETYVRNIGWVGFDVSNGISPDERYVRVATGLDYREAAPVSGIRSGETDESLHIDIQVQQ